MNNFDTKKIDWFKWKSVDKTGKIFRYEGKYYRGIFDDKVEYINTILGLPSFKNLVDDNLIPPTSITGIELAGFGMVIQTQTSAFEEMSPWLPPETVRDMALAWIRINQRLATDGYSLVDGHTWNFALFGPYPKWVDIGSIQPQPLSMSAIGEFGRCIFSPLMIMAQSPVLRRTGRLLLGAGSVSAAEMQAITGLTLHSGETEPLRALAWMEKQIKALVFESATTIWAKYTSTDELATILAEPLDDQPDERAAAFNRFLTAVNPARAIDLGSSGGNFATRIARRGIPCIAVDTDEAALTMLHCFARSKGLPITVQLRDIFHFVMHNPCPAGVDFVSAMAVTHHLALAQNTSFDDIAHVFARLTNDALVTDYMPWGLGSKGPDEPFPNPLPDWYRLEALCEALGKYFRQVDVVHQKKPEYSRRQMILCRSRI